MLFIIIEKNGIENILIRKQIDIKEDEMRKIVFDFSDIDRTELNNESKETNKKSQTSKDQMYEYIDEVIKSQKGKMGIGIHAVRKEMLKGKTSDEVLNRICENGLDIKKGSSILATVSSLGVSSELKYHQREAMKNYKLGSEMAENGVIVLVPTILEGNGQQLYVGFPGMDTSAVGNNHKTTCLLDQLCCGNNDYGEVPKEFILGYFTEKNGERIFQKNTGYFLDMSDEEKGKFIEDISSRLTEQQRQISEAVISGDMERLEQLSMDLCGNREGVFGDNTVIQNAMFYLSRERENIEQSIQEQDKSEKSKPKRKILLDAYKESQLNETDLNKSYGTLNRTKDEREQGTIQIQEDNQKE